MIFSFTFGSVCGPGVEGRALRESFSSGEGEGPELFLLAFYGSVWDANAGLANSPLKHYKGKSIFSFLVCPHHRMSSDNHPPPFPEHPVGRRLRWCVPFPSSFFLPSLNGVGAYPFFFCPVFPFPRGRRTGSIFPFCEVTQVVFFLVDPFGVVAQKETSGCRVRVPQERTNPALFHFRQLLLLRCPAPPHHRRALPSPLPGSSPVTKASRTCCGPSFSFSCGFFVKSGPCTTHRQRSG